ncbi:MAG: hypothetical protein R2799_07145 [Crocinitomicaceae bacterium]
MKYVFTLSLLSCLQILLSQDFANEFIYETNDHKQALKEMKVAQMTCLHEKYEEGVVVESYISEVYDIDASGKIVRFDDKSSIIDFEEKWIEQYFYDEQGRLIKVIYEFEEESRPPEIEETHYAYRKDGLLDSMCEFAVVNNYLQLNECTYFHYHEGLLTHTTNEEGDTLERVEFVDNNVYKFHGTYSVVTYNNGDPVKREFDDGHSWEYQFKNGIIQRSERKDQDIYTEFNYDKNGLPKEFKLFKGGVLDYKETYSYKYY